MDTHLKERLVGAAVLVAVAVILIPEMLSGPAERQPVIQSADRSADEGVRTYTIDLGTRARSGAESADAAPGAEIVTPAPPPESTEENESAPAAAVAAADSPPPPGVESRPPPEASSATASPASPAPTLRETPAAPPARQEANAKQPWAVQVGSFASQATADRLGQDLRKRGYPSFVVPFKTGSQTLYRVRIGPMQERTAADATVQKLKREGTSATVVSSS